jgi:hypothetical protein
MSTPARKTASYIGLGHESTVESPVFAIAPEIAEEKPTSSKSKRQDKLKSKRQPQQGNRAKRDQLTEMAAEVHCMLATNKRLPTVL